MPNLKNYPVGFSPYSCGTYPPIESFQKTKDLKAIKFSRYEKIEFPELNDGEFICFSDYDEDFGEAEFIIRREEKVFNKFFDKEMKQHLFKLEKWKILKEKWDKESEEEANSREYKDYLKLKKKYEK